MNIFTIPTHIPNIFLLLVPIGLVFIVFVAIIKLRLPDADEKPRYAYRKCDYVMSERERICFNALIEALGSGYYVFPQIHLNSIFEALGSGREKFAAFRHINEKSVDFVVADQNLRTVAAIELDDRSHDRTDRVQRDGVVNRLFKDMSIPLIRIDGRSPFDARGIRELIVSAREH